jgi:hypothetical protein
MSTPYAGTAEILLLLIGNWMQGLMCLMPLSTIFKLSCDHQFYLCRKLEVPAKNNDLQKVPDKL